MLLHTGARVVYSSQTHIMLLAARAIIGRAPKRALGMAAAAAGGVAAQTLDSLGTPGVDDAEAADRRGALGSE